PPSSSPRELCRFDDRKIELFSPPAPPAPSASPACPHPAILGCSSTRGIRGLDKNRFFLTPNTELRLSQHHTTAIMREEYLHRILPPLQKKYASCVSPKII
ncbi:MAG: hypothetical protein QNJ51_17180, partial [Calothrix sp. MO_167.B12]|nr:hypothetical protein [Calothrix sp. MO_167.B12]